MNYISKSITASCLEELRGREQVGNLKTTEKNLTKGNEDERPKSHGSQRSTGSKKSPKPPTTKKKSKCIADHSDPDDILAFRSRPQIERTLPKGVEHHTPHPCTPEEATSMGSVSSMPAQLQHSQSGPRSSSVRKSGNEDDRPTSHGSQRSTGSKKSPKPPTTKKKSKCIADHSDPDGIEAFKSRPKLPVSPPQRDEYYTPHPCTHEEATSMGSVSSMPAQLHSQSGPRSSSARKSAKPDVGKPEYEKTPEQKGLMLILNFSKDREGSLDDVGKLREFFKSTFEFDIEIEPNLTKDGLIAVLTEIRDSYMNAPIIARKYYCFICVVMSHGDKDGIKTNDDKRITMDEITSHFKNKQTPGFLGKPKIFIVQACRGSSTQSLVVADDSSEDIKDYVGKMSVPHDADILIAYATTQGYKAFRTINSDEGAWFIHVLLQIIEESYKVDHFEDMLISVRYKIALGPEWSKGENCQMPCSWTTLTKRFYLK